MNIGGKKRTCKTIKNYCHCKMADAKKFDKRSFRSRKTGGRIVTFGCPKGKWNARSKRCKVGTRAVNLKFSKAWLKEKHRRCA
jgi:hypothetical protein